MGMFDYIKHECVCPNCHQKVTGFQSKDAACELDALKPTDVRNFYTDCHCGTWIEFAAMPTTNYEMTATKDDKVIAKKKVSL